MLVGRLRGEPWGEDIAGMFTNEGWADNILILDGRTRGDPWGEGMTGILTSEG
jgi:hypothetical protein